jgi:ABC-type glycerol-3-phosphate transport system substrate-binding protein
MPRYSGRPPAVTRRRFLAALPGGLAAASLLAACGGTAQGTAGTGTAASVTAAVSTASTASATAPATTAAATTAATTASVAASTSASASAPSTASTATSTVQASASSAVGKAGGLTVTYMSDLPDTHPEGKARLGLLAEYTKTNTDGVTVDVSGAKTATSLDKAFALAAAGTPPDLIYVAYYDAAALLAKGAVIDLDAQLRPEKGWTAQKADIFPDMLSSSTWTGKLAGMPCYTNNTATVYSPQLLSQIGVPTPKPDWNWQDFQDLAQKGNKPPDRWGYDWNWVLWSDWLGSAGGFPISTDAQKITMTTPEAQDTLTYLANLLKIGVTPPKSMGELFNTTKATGVVFETQGPYRLPTLRQNKITDIAVVPTPIKKNVFASNGGHNVSVFQGIPADHKQAAARITMWLNAPHAQAQMCIQATSLPVSNAAFQSTELQDYLKTDPQLKGFIDLAPHGWRWPALPSYAKISGALNSAVSDILTGKVSVQDGLTQGQQAAQVLLDQDLKLQ